jgi:hypothetical protein
MEEAYKAKLAELRKKDPSALSDADRAELHALRSYLHPHEKIAFGLEEPAEEKPQDGNSQDEIVKPSKGLNKAQLQEALTAKGVEFPPEATKVQLQALLDGVSVEDEDDQPEDEE